MRNKSQKHNYSKISTMKLLMLNKISQMLNSHLMRIRTSEMLMIMVLELSKIGILTSSYLLTSTQATIMET